MKIRISAESESSACIFVQRMLLYLERITGQQITAAAICSEVVANVLAGTVGKFVPIEDWRFPEASTNVVKLAEEGINLVILSEKFTEWATEKENINEDLESFEKALFETGMTVIQVETHDNYAQLFGHSNQWPAINFETLLSLMVDDYSDDSLVHPWGALPYFIVESIPLEELETSRSIKVLAGFQPWTYARNSTEFYPVKFPFIHWLSDGNKSQKSDQYRANATSILSL